MIFETSSWQEVEQHIIIVTEFIRQGLDLGMIKKTKEMNSLSPDVIVELYRMAQARILYKKIQPSLFMQPEDGRFATDSQVATWRAIRLSCTVLLEIGCGIGAQTIAFAEHCKRVIAIDIDPRKIAYAKANMAKHGISNVEFIIGDGLSYLESCDHGLFDVVFLDPERPSHEKERSFEKLTPRPEKILSLFDDKKTRLAIELPPHLRTIPLQGELEYLSVDGKLNRLTLYVGKNTTQSAVLLPQKAVVNESTPIIKRESIPTILVHHYLYVMDPAIVQAHLMEHVPLPFAVWKSGKSFILTSERYEPTEYAIVYQVIAIGGIDEIQIAMNEYQIGKIVLRGSVDPLQYYPIKSRFEQGMTGEKTGHLWQGEQNVLAVKIH